MFKLNDRVVHKRFGLGTVVVAEENPGVCFDNKTFNLHSCSYQAYSRELQFLDVTWEQLDHSCYWVEDRELSLIGRKPKKNQRDKFEGEPETRYRVCLKVTEMEKLN